MLEAVRSEKGPPGALKICVLIDEGYDTFDPSAYLTDVTWELYCLNRRDSVQSVQQLAKRGFDIFLNLCDSTWINPYVGPEVVHALEQAGVAFTGADSAFYEPSRENQKRVCRLNGILAPESCEAFCEADIRRASAELRYPLIVKPINSYGSVGIERASRVETFEALHRQTQLVLQEFNGALIEEFIEGDEYTLLVVENADDPSEPFIYPPTRYIFPNGETFDHYEAKWVLDKLKRCIPCSDPDLNERLIDAGRKLFVGLNGVSYGRCDLRVNAAGEIYVLEINPNCALFFPIEEITDSSDRILLEHPEGHRGFLKRIFKAALARQKRLQPSWYVRHTPEQGYGLYARRQIGAGEIILKGEQSAHTLLSWEQVQQNWNEDERRIFERHAYPLAEELWVVPSRDPGEWKPINHACDPNAWWQGLDVAARRTIAADEQITLDYATFFDERMAEFSCWCGAEACRKTIRGTDYRLPNIECYAGHLSDYIDQKRRAQKKQIGGVG